MPYQICLPETIVSHSEPIPQVDIKKIMVSNPNWQTLLDALLTGKTLQYTFPRVYGSVSADTYSLLAHALYYKGVEIINQKPALLKIYYSLPNDGIHCKTSNPSYQRYGGVKTISLQLFRAIFIYTIALLQFKVADIVAITKQLNSFMMRTHTLGVRPISLQNKARLPSDSAIVAIIELYQARNPNAFKSVTGSIFSEGDVCSDILEFIMQQSGVSDYGDDAERYLQIAMPENLHPAVHTPVAIEQALSSFHQVLRIPIMAQPKPTTGIRLDSSASVWHDDPTAPLLGASKSFSSCCSCFGIFCCC